MTIWILLATGLFFAIFSSLNNLLKTIFRRLEVGFFDLLLVFMATLLWVATLIIAYFEASPDPLIQQLALITGGVFAAAHLLVILLELFRPQRLKASRGLLGVFSGGLIALSSFSVPYIAIYFSLTALQPPVSVVANSATAAAPAESGEATAEVTAQTQRFIDLFRTVFTVIAEETGLAELAIVDLLEAGTPLAQVIRDNGGDVFKVVNQISVIAGDTIRASVAAGEIAPEQAAGLLSQMNGLIFLIVNADITTLGGQLNGDAADSEGTPQATRPSLRSLFVTETAPLVTNAVTATFAPNTATLTLMPTATWTPNPPTETATARPTSPPSATRFQFSTRTPVPTMTAVTPCLASVEYNLRLRIAPDVDSETLLVIPFGTTIELIGRGESTAPDQFWWLGRYEGSEGWVDGSYMIVSRACATLPILNTVD